MRRILLLICTIAAGAAASPASWAGEVSVMSFNIRYGTANDGENSWDKRRDLVADTIREYDPDIVGMQECLLFQAEFLESALDGYGRIGVGRERNGGGERMEILYRYERLAPLQTGHYWLSETPGEPGSKSWNSSNVRMVTWAEFFDYESRERFYYFNTHFDHRSEEARQGAAKLLASDIPLRSKGLPTILTGDFNTPAESGEAWNILTGVGLKDAWLAAEERVGPPITWSGFDAPREGQDRRIDWILISEDMECSHAETVLYNVGGRYPSDHYPVFSRLRW